MLEPQNVDPSMVQMTFLDDVVHSLLKGENIGITSRRRSRSNQNSNTVHVDTFIFLPKYFCILQILKSLMKLPLSPLITKLFLGSLYTCTSE